MAVERIIGFADLDKARTFVQLTQWTKGCRARLPSKHVAVLRIDRRETLVLFTLSVAEVYVLAKQANAFLDAVRKATAPRKKAKGA